MILQTSAWVLVRFTAHRIHIGRKEAKQDILSLFAPPPQSQLGNWDRLVSAGEIHCRSIDWEKVKQICSSVTITAEKAGKDELVLVRFIAEARSGGGKADLILHHNHSCEAGKHKLVLGRFIADAKIGRRQSRFAPPSQLQLESWER